LGRSYFQAGDEIIFSQMEHHSNIVPWQMLALEKKLKLRVIPIDDKGELRLDVFEKLLTSKTKLLAVSHVSNALGTINPIAKMARMARARGALVLVDGAQSAGHLKIDVQALGADFFVFSGHKLYGPTGVGVLYGRKALLERFSPAKFGGGMIENVFLKTSSFAPLPLKFEAGTPMIAEAVALKKALDYLENLGHEKLQQHERALLEYATQKLLQIEGLKIIGQAQEKAAIISFSLDKIHPLDLAMWLDLKKIALRSGHHCAQPTMRHFKLPATARISFGVYNTKEEIERFFRALQKAVLELRK
jgi:cysteine desulfurase/selenocysteine lyase